VRIVVRTVRHEDLSGNQMYNFGHTGHAEDTELIKYACSFEIPIVAGT